jgi:hypothetical protein
MSSSGELLPIRIERHGWVAAQDGFLLVFFIRASHREAAESVGGLYDRWLEIVGPESVRWVRGANDWKELTPRQRTRVRKLLTKAGATKSEARVAVKAGANPDDVMVHGFDYWAQDLEASPQAASFVEIRLPTEWIRARGLDDVFAMAVDFAGRVEFSSGYASLAFNVDMEIPGFIDERAFDHPGMDVHANEYTALYIGDLVRGAYWLTFVGPTALERLGGAAKLKRALGGEITVVEVGEGVAIRAGDELRPGDVPGGDVLPLTRKVAASLEPVRLQQTIGAFGFTDDAKFPAWQRRHVS